MKSATQHAPDAADAEATRQVDEANEAWGRRQAAEFRMFRAIGNGLRTLGVLVGLTCYGFGLVRLFAGNLGAGFGFLVPASLAWGLVAAWKPAQASAGRLGPFGR